MIDIDSQCNEAANEKGQYIIFTDCVGHNQIKGAERLALECFLRKPLTS